MLFDLRSAGRRRAIKVVYVTLAILMGGGLVLFGIGGAVSGGLVDALTEGGGGGDSGIERFEERERAAAARTRSNPQDAAAWAALARARVQIASFGDNYDPNTDKYSRAGRAKLVAAAAAWNRHLELADKADDRLAGLMVQAFVALQRPKDAVRAQEVITEARPSPGSYAQLAIFAYQAGNTRTANLARAEALRRAPKTQRTQLKTQLDAAKKQAAGASG
jgi:hypothetical protein